MRAPVSEALEQALRAQANYCETGGSPFTSRVLTAAADDLAARGPFAAVLAPWAGDDFRALIDAAVPLRLAAALHHLVLAGAAPDLAAAYPPHAADDLPVRLVRAAAGHGEALAAFTRTPPQTNEVRRAMGLVVGFAEIAARTGLPLACLEIGASAGLLTQWDRFGYAAADGSWRRGDPGSPVQLDSDWRGPPPADAPIRVASRRACDVDPVRLTDPEARRRLEAYVWADQPERLARLRAAAELFLASGLAVEAADAGEWLEANLAPRAGVVTVLYHSVMWQYLPPVSRAAVHAALTRASAQATPEAPLAWLRFEPPGGDARRGMEVRLALWPGGGDRLVARSNAHAAQVENLTGDAAPAVEAPGG